MRVLGIACGISAEYENNELTSHVGHDAAAALVEDGRIVAAIEEERLSRIKHSNFFPSRAIGWCLQFAGIHPNDLDRIAVSFSEPFANAYVERRFLANPACSEVTGRSFVSGLFQRHLGWENEEAIRFCNHHESHAWSAYVPSTFSESVVLVLDGVGEDGRGPAASGLVAVARGNELEVINRFSLEQSLGIFYQHLIQVLGFRVFDEYKVMALASYGDPARFHSLFESLFELLPNGQFRLASAKDQLSALKCVGLAQKSRRQGAPIELWQKDFAAALQRTLETIVLHILRYARTRTSVSSLCVAGGVGLNSVLNGKIAESGIFERAFFQPASHDAGNALGAAFAGSLSSNQHPLRSSMALGSPCAGDAEIGPLLTRWDAFLQHISVQDVTEHVATLLAAGQIVGWVRGRSEFGPRALGNRSILADPRSAALRDRLNRDIKNRESFRPFAPAVTDLQAQEYFELPVTCANLSHMNVVVKVRPRYQMTLPGVTHVDGSARLQVVHAIESPDFWKLIDTFGKITGVSVLLNTSFNRAGEPIVDSADDAIASFLNMDFDHLVIGNHCIQKHSNIDLAFALLSHRIVLAPYKKLVRRAGSLDPEFPHLYMIESNAGPWFDEVQASISEFMFTFLITMPKCRTMDECRRRCQFNALTWEVVVAEIASLWRRRLIAIS